MLASLGLYLGIFIQIYDLNNKTNVLTWLVAPFKLSFIWVLDDYGTMYALPSLPQAVPFGISLPGPVL